MLLPGPPDQLWCMEPRKSVLVSVLRILLMMNSMASTGFISWSSRRSIQTRFKFCFGISNSSFLVPERTRSKAGNTRRSAILRSRCNSILPVPLNSSKMTSSILLPVSIRAVEMMVRLPTANCQLPTADCPLPTLFPFFHAFINRSPSHTFMTD